MERSNVNDPLSVKDVCNNKCFPFAHAAKVGKTSLIMSLVSEEFPDEVCIYRKSHDRVVKIILAALSFHSYLVQIFKGWTVNPVDLSHCYLVVSK